MACSPPRDSCSGGRTQTQAPNSLAETVQRFLVSCFERGVLDEVLKSCVGEGTMVDTWATVGSCAQVGKHCHLSGGAGIGGVLEPLQASPTIIEDHCFIGARSEVVEGFVVGHHSVIGMGVFLGQSTRVYNRATGEISYGSVPPYSVVVSGQLPAKDGSHSLYCAVIVKQVDAKTIAKTSINELLRGLAE